MTTCPPSTGSAGPHDLTSWAPSHLCVMHASHLGPRPPPTPVRNACLTPGLLHSWDPTRIYASLRPTAGAPYAIQNTAACKEGPRSPSLRWRAQVPSSSPLIVSSPEPLRCGASQRSSPTRDACSPGSPSAPPDCAQGGHHWRPVTSTHYRLEASSLWKQRPL